jgi:anti-sigma-K factor RskA
VVTRPPDDSASKVERELAALGEAPLAPEEEVLLARSDGETHEEARTIAALVELSTAPPEEELSQLDRFRIWRKVEASRPAAGALEDEAHPTSLPRWRSVVAGLAVAAGVALWVRGQPVERTRASDSPSVKALAEEARRGFAALGGTSGTKRARTLARTYARRLEVEE